MLRIEVHNFDILLLFQNLLVEIINIENIPLYEDEIGPFGSTTSDTPRTMVTENTKKILLFMVKVGICQQCYLII